MQATRVFISYSHRDEAWKDHVRRFLDGLSGLQVTAWDDREIEPGSSWRADIDRAMQECHVALLLISQDFLNSNFIRTVEIPRLHARWQAKEVVVIPVLVRASHWLEHEWLKDLQGWPRDSALLGAMSAHEYEALLQQLASIYVARRQAPEALPKARSGEPPKVDLSRLPETARFFFGRDAERAQLDAAWRDSGGTEIVVLVALGGTGKTALVLDWLERLRREHWGGARAVFAWSFAAQGVSEVQAGSRQGSEDAFFEAALRFFGQPPAVGDGIETRARNLFQALSSAANLLILDGLEALQNPPGVLDGCLRAPGMALLLRALARAGHPGLCLITTRAPVEELAAQVRCAEQPQGSVLQIDLDNLQPADGARLLHRLGVDKAGWFGIGADHAELLAISERLKGHALTLRFVGLYLRHAHDGNVRRFQRIDFNITGLPKGVAAVYAQACAAMYAYEYWLQLPLPKRWYHGLPFLKARDQRRHDDKQRHLAVLRVLSLFDYPAPPDSVLVLCQPAIPGLSKALAGLAAADWQNLLDELGALGLLQRLDWQPPTVSGYDEDVAIEAMAANARNERFDLGEPHTLRLDPAGLPFASRLELHPLLREFFALRLQHTADKAVKLGHARLYEHLSASVPYWPEGEAGLAPLYQAVAHGCRAGRYQEACDDVYRDRINRRSEAYAVHKLGLYGTELSAVAHFFREPWRTPVAAPALSDSARAWLLNTAAFHLRALGRLTEAVEPMQATVEMLVAQQGWTSAATAASNLSELQQTLGALRAAIAAGEAAVRHADASGDAFARMAWRTTLAEARQQAGETAAALTGLAAAEALQAQGQPEYPRLYSLQGFRYCDALLQSAERTAWAAGTGAAVEAAQRLERLAELQAVEARAAWAAENEQGRILDIALDHLTLARVSLYRSRLLAASDPQAAAAALQAATMAAGQAVDGLRKAGSNNHIPRGLLTRACVHSLNADADAARADLDEAQRIAERGGMKLFLADVHLHRARLFDDRTALAAARQLIDEIGYERRRGELDDAQCRLDGRAVVLPAFASVLTQARGENLPEPPPATDPTP